VNDGTTGLTWSCTKRGFSCPATITDRSGIACATIDITDDAVVSYTTFSPVSRCPFAGTTGGMFSVILSVSAGYCPPNPRSSRGVSPFGVRTFLSPHKAKSGCLTNRLLLLDKCPGFLTRTCMQSDKRSHTIYNFIGIFVSMPRFASLSASLFFSLGTWLMVN